MCFPVLRYHPKPSSWNLDFLPILQRFCDSDINVLDWAIYTGYSSTLKASTVLIFPALMDGPAVERRVDTRTVRTMMVMVSHGTTTP